MGKKKECKVVDINNNGGFSIKASDTFYSLNSNFKHCEWCFQFDNDEPVVFGSTPRSYPGETAKMTFTLTNSKSSDLYFVDAKTNKKIRIFARKKQL